MDYKLCEGIQMSQTLKKYLIVVSAAVMFSVSSLAYSGPCPGHPHFCDGEDIDLSGVNDSIEENAERIEQVNKEDMRVKSGELNDGTLTLRVEDMEKSDGRDYIYGKDVNIDLSDLDQSAEVSENRTDIDTNTTNISNNRTDIDQNTDRSVANENRSVDNSQRISNNRDDIETNTQNINTNTSAISDVRGYTVDNRRSINTNAYGIETNRQAINANAYGIETNRQAIKTNAYGIETNRQAINTNAYGIETNRQAIVDTNARIDGVMNDMKYLDRNLSAGVASAMAIGQHQFDPSYSGGQVSLSGGFYNGENAVSFAVGVPVGERAFFSAAIAADSGSNGESGSVGMTFKLP